MLWRVTKLTDGFKSYGASMEWERCWNSLNMEALFKWKIVSETETLKIYFKKKVVNSISTCYEAHKCE